MHVAELSLCKELYELSGWDGTKFAYGKWTPEDKKSFIAEYNYGEFGHDAFRIAPCYDLGYLLRRLPEITLKSNWKKPPAMDGSRFHDDTLRWTAIYYRVKYIVSISVDADTPEDAVCKLAIELFNQGILKNEH